MNVSERAVQLWPLLAWAATNRQTLTYDIVSRLIGVLRPGIGQLLEPIQSYCLVNDLPPLTSIVVSKESGLPGSGCAVAVDFPASLAKVLNHNWLESSCPLEHEFSQALLARPTNGVANP